MHDLYSTFRDMALRESEGSYELHHCVPDAVINAPNPYPRYADVLWMAAIMAFQGLLAVEEVETVCRLGGLPAVCITVRGRAGELTHLERGGLKPLLERFIKPRAIHWLFRGSE